MSATKKKTSKPKQEYGPGRIPGTAGPEATYILKAINRWRLRGDGILK